MNDMHVYMDTYIEHYIDIATGNLEIYANNKDVEIQRNPAYISTETLKGLHCIQSSNM